MRGNETPKGFQFSQSFKFRALLLPRAAQAANQTWAWLRLALVVDSDAATVVACATGPGPRSSTVRAARPGFSEPQRSKLPVTLFCAPR